MNSELSKKKFTQDEDFLLRSVVMMYGPHNWRRIAQMIPNRTARQCRDRYINYLQPFIRHGEWTVEEDKLLLQKVSEIGTKWTIIKKSFYGRSTSALKNRFYVQLGGWKKKKKMQLLSHEKTIPENSHQDDSNSHLNEHSIICNDNVEKMPLENEMLSSQNLTSKPVANQESKSSNQPNSTVPNVFCEEKKKDEDIFIESVDEIDNREIMDDELLISKICDQPNNIKYENFYCDEPVSFWY
ncbi:Myb-like DNA-binding domain containing protein [Tritrichomonas foetus]|uniref:Myb-like DNA-binding domain containing protein n=1 Tax=Tritrichomonas foetus TaxID=1144522 RepID=A0A1J4KRM9_9EUKA|nr:Myb-like DNA-binding domain containing protein [Tritrichomonas foetus]|eukprot:OHT12117.1 Myb-like DNA-binding domain containing protein [Tritrichomonas foetus]